MLGKTIFQAIINLVDNVDLRKKIGVNARVNSKKFSADIMTENYLKAYCIKRLMKYQFKEKI